MSLRSYIFGGDTGLSYDQLQKRRAILDAMMERESAAPQNVGEGIYALGSGILEGIERRRQRKAEEGMAPKTAGLWDDVSSLMGGGSTSSSIETPSFGPAAGNLATGDNVGPMSADDPDVYNQFIDTVKAGDPERGIAGITNPNALAAIAATGQAESGYNASNAYGSWSDPSQSGQAGQAGGIMSWRAERLDAMRQFAADNGDDPNRPSPSMQAKFLLQEDPALMQRLEAAQSPEDAQNLMNGAWRFAGFDKPGGESARRLSYAKSYLPTFAGQEQAATPAGASMDPVRVASLDPAAGSTPIGTPVMTDETSPDLAAQGKEVLNGVVQDANAAPSLRDMPEPGMEAAPMQPQGMAAPANPAGSSSGRQNVLDVLMQKGIPIPQAAPRGIAQAGAGPQTGRAAVEDAMLSRPQIAPPAPRESIQRVAQAMSPPAAPQQDARIPRAMAIMSNPAASPEQRAIAGSVLQQAMKPQEYGFQTMPDGTVLRTDPRTGQVSPVYQGREKPLVVDGALIDPSTGREIYRAPGDPMKMGDGESLIGRDGTVIYQGRPKPEPRTDDMREFEYAKGQGYSGNFVDFQRDMKRAGATSVTVGTGGDSGKFYDELDKNRGKTFNDMSEAGNAARRSMIQIDELDERLANVGTGGLAAIKQFAGEYGIPVGDLSDSQAASALINQLVPAQRPPGSGSMSDGDVAMFKASLPRIANQPGGNQLIIQTLRGIATYDMQRGEIADRVADREITPAQGRKLMAELPNPLADYRKDAKRPGGRQSDQAPASGAASQVYRDKYGLE